MKIMKKAAIFILCCVLVFSLSGCVVLPGRNAISQEGSDGQNEDDLSRLEDLLKTLLQKLESVTGDADEEEDAGEDKETGEDKDAGRIREERDIPDYDQKPEKEDSDDAATDDAAIEEEKPEDQPGKQKESDNKETQDNGQAETGSFLPEYYHYDKADFDALLEVLENAAKDGDEAALEKAYDAAFEELLKLEDLYGSIYLTYAHDVSNQENDDEMNYADSLVVDCRDELCTVCHNILKKAKNDDFENYLGKEVADMFLDYEPMDDEIKALRDRITDLETDYNAELNKLDQYSYEYNGREWTFEDLEDSELASELAQSDPQGYLSIYDGILHNFNEAVGPIYLELVDLNNQVARYYGYDNYAEYAYKEVYGRDYTVQDAGEFCEVIKQNVAPQYYTYVYYGGAFSTDIDYDSNIEGLLSSLEFLADEISPLAAEAYQDFTEQKLYDLGYEDNRLEGAYTSTLAKTGKPYIYAHLGDRARDLITVAHEFGHFTYFDLQENYNYWLDSMSGLDLMEMHSNGFDVLSTKYYDRFFGPQADDALHYALANILSSVVDGCIQDEFQRRVYAENDLTLDRVNEIYTEVVSSYGGYTFGSENYEWCFVPHNYQTPFYYLSYAVSGLTALEIWSISQEDYDKGVEAWENLIKYTSDREDYFTTLEKCGLSAFTDSEKVNEICGTVLQKFGAGVMWDLEKWLDEIMN